MFHFSMRSKQVSLKSLIEATLKQEVQNNISGKKIFYFKFSFPFSVAQDILFFQILLC